MGHPRFVLSATWDAAFRRDFVRYADGPRASTQALTVVCWRLLSANNRQLGRSAGTFANALSARAAALVLQAHLDCTESSVTRLAAPVRWVWSLSSEGSVAAMSGRSYETQRMVVRALRLFLSGAAGAPVAVPEQLRIPPRTALTSLAALERQTPA